MYQNCFLTESCAFENQPGEPSTTLPRFLISMNKTRNVGHTYQIHNKTRSLLGFQLKHTKIIVKIKKKEKLYYMT